MAIIIVGQSLQQLLFITIAIVVNWPLGITYVIISNVMSQINLWVLQFKILLADAQGKKVPVTFTLTNLNSKLLAPSMKPFTNAATTAATFAAM